MAKSFLRTTLSVLMALVLCAAMLAVPQRAANAEVTATSIAANLALGGTEPTSKALQGTVEVTTGDPTPTVTFSGLDTTKATIGAATVTKRAVGGTGTDIYDFSATATMVAAGTTTVTLNVNGTDVTGKTCAIACTAVPRTGNVRVNGSNPVTINLQLGVNPTAAFSVDCSNSAITGLEYELGAITQGSAGFTVNMTSNTGGSITGTSAGSGTFVVQAKTASVTGGDTVTPITVNVNVTAAPAAAPSLSVTRNKAELWPSDSTGNLSIVLSNANTTYPANAYFYVYSDNAGRVNFNTNPYYGNLTDSGSGTGSISIPYTRGNTVGTATITVRVYESSTGVTTSYKEATVTVINNASNPYLYLDLEHNTLTNSQQTTTAHVKLWPVVINNGTTYYPTITDRVFWRSSNSKIVSIESYDGNFDSNLNASASLKARRNGTVTIYAYMGDWSNPVVIASHKITVNASYLPQTGQDMTLVYVGCGLSLFLLVMGAWVYYAQRKELRTKA